MKLSFVKNYFSFTLHLISLLILGVLGFIKGADVASAIVLVAASYAGSHTIAHGNAAWAASKDPNCDTKEVIALMQESNK